MSFPFSLAFPLRMLHNAEEHPMFPDVLSSSIPNAFEADCWVYSGKIWVHHDRRLWRTPVLYGKWGIRFRFLFPRLEDFSLRTDPNTIIKIDLKHRPDQDPQDMAVTFQNFFKDHSLWQNRSYFCLETLETQWIRTFKSAFPAIPLFLTVGTTDEMKAVKTLLSNGLQIEGICASHNLFPTQEPQIELLIKNGLWIDIWTVNDVFAADELIKQGVHIITSDSLDVLESIPRRVQRG